MRCHSLPRDTRAASLLCEIVMTFMFVMIVLGVTDKRATDMKGFAPLAIGLALTLIHLVSIPVTNTSVNPARSTGPAPIAGSWAMGQLWLFWVAPIVGAVIAGVAYLAYQLVAGRAAERPPEGTRTPVTTPSERLEPAHGSTW